MQFINSKLETVFTCTLLLGLTHCKIGISDTAKDQSPKDETPPSTELVVYEEGLQYNGSIILATPNYSATSYHSNEASGYVEISGPIFPDVAHVLYQFEDENYPTTHDGEEALVGDAALTFEFLLQECKDRASESNSYGDITLNTDVTTPLNDAQLSVNFNAVASCAYSEFGSKPYWIPKLINSVDICGKELGTGWRMIQESDLAALTSEQLAFLKETLTTTAAEGANMGSFYFGLNIYAKTADNHLAQASLDPDASREIVDLSEIENQKTHREGGVALRCIREL